MGNGRLYAFRDVSRFIIILAFFLGVSTAQAQTPSTESRDPQYFQIKKTRTREVIESGTSSQKLSPLQDHPTQDSMLIPESDPLISIDGMGIGAWAIQAGMTKLWEIVENNKAVVNTDFKGASALPAAAEGDWTKVTGWKPEHSLIYNYEAINAYNQKVVQLKYKVSLRYGGTLRGKGKYIASARVVPIHIQVLWGFKLSVDVKVVKTENSGSEKNPMAAIRLHVVHKIKSPLKNSTEKQSYYLKGDGYIEDTKTGKIFFESPSEVPMEPEDL